MPYLADGMGRRFAVFIGATLMVVGAILQASSQNVGMFIGARHVYFFFIAYKVMKKLKCRRFLSECHRSIMWYRSSISCQVGCGSAFATNSAPVCPPVFSQAISGSMLRRLFL